MLEPGPDFVLRGHHNTVNTLKYLSCSLLASGSGDGEISVWNTTNRRQIERKHSTDASVLSLSLIKSRGHLISCSRDGIARVWDVNNGLAETNHLTCGVEHFCNACTDESNEDPNTLVTPSAEESKMLMWDLRCCGSPVMQSTCPSEHGMITCLHYNSSFCGTSISGTDASAGGLLLAGCESGVVLSFDIRTGLRVVCEAAGHKEPVMCLASFTSTHSVISGSADNKVCVYRSPSQDCTIDVIASSLLAKPGTGAVRYRSDGRVVVSGHWDGSVRIFATKKMKPLAIMRHHQESVYAVDFSPECTCINSGNNKTHPQARGIFATGSKDCTIATWSIYSDSLKCDDSVRGGNC